MGSGAKAPAPPPRTPLPEDPAANEQAKSAAAEAKSRANKRARQGSLNNTLATAGEGSLGSASTNKPDLKSNLG